MGLPEIRIQINNIDERLEEFLIQRLSLIKDVAVIKKQRNLPITDHAREDKIVEAMKKRVPQEYEPYVTQFFRSMFEVSKKYQSDLINN